MQQVGTKDDALGFASAFGGAAGTECASASARILLSLGMGVHTLDTLSGRGRTEVVGWKQGQE